MLYLSLFKCPTSLIFKKKKINNIIKKNVSKKKALIIKINFTAKILRLNVR